MKSYTTSFSIVRHFQQYYTEKKPIINLIFSTLLILLLLTIIKLTNCNTHNRMTHIIICLIGNIKNINSYIY